MHLQITANITTADMCTDNVNCIWKVHSINYIVDIHLNILVMIMRNNVCIHTGDKNIHTIGSTKQRTENFTKYYFLTPPPLHLQRGGQEYSEGGLRKSLRGGKEMLQGG